MGAAIPTPLKENSQPPLSAFVVWSDMNKEHAIENLFAHDYKR
jgi:hypothetical protein